MNIDNLNKLIDFMGTLPAAQIDMSALAVTKLEPNSCGTAGCIAGWAVYLAEGSYDPKKRVSGTTAPAAGSFIGITAEDYIHLFFPRGYSSGTHRYPAYRVIATLKRLRDTYLATGQVVVDWGHEPGEEPKTPWVAPQVAEVIAPALPAEITSLLRPSPVKTEA